MFDDLFTEYLKKVFPSDYVDMIHSAREALVNFDYSLCEANLYKTMPDVSDIDVSTSKMLFEQCLRDGFNEVFMLIGIRSKIHKLIDCDTLLRAIKNLEVTTLHEEVIDLIASDEYAQAEVLEKLLELVSTDPNIADLIFDFELTENNMLFNRLYDYHLAGFRSTNGEATDVRPDRKYLDGIKNFTNKFPDTLVARKLLAKDILFGETYQHYIAENTEELQQLYPNHPDRVPCEFAGLAMFANVQRHELSSHIKIAIAKFYGDLKFTTKTNYLVDKFLEELEYEHQPASMVQAGY